MVVDVVSPFEEAEGVQRFMNALPKK
ncbi:hypothetical protein RV134_330017 [Roseovarius sp. EC-HK134]|nr:hypothetical protein RV420_390017 [Roseovarius sp. EC-SD190]VVT24495.1 hypothetical protein RV134_330017 [Roseovarius sp. EC-HK134]